MKIAFFTDTFYPQVNGVARTLGRLSSFLDRKGISHLIFAPTTEERFFNNVRELWSIPFLLYPECRLSLPNPFSISRQLQAFQPDLIHSATEFNIGFSGMHYARQHQIPFVTSYHTNFADYLRYYQLEALEKVLWNYLRWFHSHASRVFCPSQATRRSLEMRGFSNTALWSRGVDTQTFNPLHRSSSFREHHQLTERTTLLYVGRIAPEKNLEILRDTYLRLRQQHGDTLRLIVTGDGPSLPDFRRSMPENVIFTGYKEGQELSTIYASSDIFLFPSTTETFGNVVLEAMASGLPVVTSNQGGVTENVHSGVNGFQADCGIPGDFYTKAALLVENPHLRQAMSQSSLDWASYQNWEQIFSRLLAEYEQALAEEKTFHTA